LNVTTLLLTLFVVQTLAFASIAVDESISKSTLTTTILTLVSTQTVIVTTAPQSYPVTFAVPPSQCNILALCVNATLVDHLGQNVTVFAVAWFKNATTGQNASEGNLKGGSSTTEATCSLNPTRPQSCYLIYGAAAGVYNVTVFVLSTDGKTALSASVTIKATGA
jgi:hypothetical protein